MFNARRATRYRRPKGLSLAYLGRRLRTAQREIELCPQPEPSRNTCTEKADAPEPQTTESRRSPDLLPIPVLVAQSAALL